MTRDSIEVMVKDNQGRDMFEERVSSDNDESRVSFNSSITPRVR